MLRAALFIAQALFLWMFFSTQSLERMADANLVSGDVYRFAAEWRHGLAGWWPLYMPGFFVCAVVTWVWCIGRTLRALIPELLLITIGAAIVAFALTPFGGELALGDLFREQGISTNTPAPYPHWRGVATGVYSVLAWNASVLSCHRALAWWSFWPLLVPVILDIGLYLIRPYTFDEALSTWSARALAGDSKAILSYGLIPVSAFALGVIQLAHQRGMSVRCFLFGHSVNNQARDGLGCACGMPHLDFEGITRFRHNLSCFFGGHYYRFAGARHAHKEYFCVRCGHPLLLTAEPEGKGHTGVFRKFVHYRCGLLGHQVHAVTRRQEGVEYACYCGHSFLRSEEESQTIRHPWHCIFFGHFVAFTGRRFGLAEFVCRHCGHPFLLGR